MTADAVGIYARVVQAPGLWDTRFSVVSHQISHGPSSRGGDNVIASCSDRIRWHDARCAVRDACDMGWRHKQQRRRDRRGRWRIYFTPESTATVFFDRPAVAMTATHSSGVFTAVFKHQSAPGSHNVKAVDTSGLESSSSSVSAVTLQQLLPGAGTYIALYMPPTGAGWAELQKIINARRAHLSVPVVVTINPSSGLGSYRNSNFAWGIAQLREAGVIVLGYVCTTAMATGLLTR